MVRRRFEVRACSITETGAVAVVNASNERALLGGGVSRALFEECGGAVLQHEMQRKLEDEHGGVLEEGHALVTSAGTSKRIRHLIHVPAVDYRAAGRAGDGGVETAATSPERIRACATAAVDAASRIAAVDDAPISIAFPLLGAGAGGLSVVVACRAMVEGIRDAFARAPDAGVDLVVFAVPEPDRFDLCSSLVHAAFA